ncbi:MAG: hypothetical protein PHP23_02550 [Desulfobacterales bacterium]|nr:hypothetical protein [Desulfobacterales bacterium]MDD4071133.1 hypothetical protein [Desulfobacterales bacterium]
MRFKKSPVYRKIIFPWYESESFYLVLTGFMCLVVAFGLTGISVAREYDPCHRYLWLPVLLVVMSGSVLVSCLVRLIIRYIGRSSK